MNLPQAIVRSRQLAYARTRLRKVRQHIYSHEDQGRGEKNVRLQVRIAERIDAIKNTMNNPNFNN